MTSQSLEELNHYLELAAEIVVMHGTAYLPIMERFEREIEAAEKKIDGIKRAQDLIAKRRQQNVSNTGKQSLSADLAMVNS